MTTLPNLRDPDSPDVKAALKRHCPTCGANERELCTALSGRPLSVYRGQLVHLIRADGLPYTSAERRKK